MTALEIPECRLDPRGEDRLGEAARLQEAGPVVRIVLPPDPRGGDVRAWAVTCHNELLTLWRDPEIKTRTSADYHHWTAWRNGQISPSWPGWQMTCVNNMFTADGEDHARQRHAVQRVLTVRKVSQMRPRIAGIVEALLDALPGHASPDGVVDVKANFAVALPMAVVAGQLMGVPADWQPELLGLVQTVFSSSVSPQDAAEAEDNRIAFLDRLVKLRTREPDESLTSDLIRDRETAGNPMADTELADTAWIMLTAGWQTTSDLIANAILALLTHDEQRRSLGAGPGLTASEAAWDDVVEETLRWDPPVNLLTAAYTTGDIEIGGTTIPAGEAIYASYTAANRDPRQHGADAGIFDVARERHSHLAFADGPHRCLGAPLAKAEALEALPALFRRYQGLRLAVRPDEIKPAETFYTNSVQALPVHLTPPTPAEAR